MNKFFTIQKGKAEVSIYGGGRYDVLFVADNDDAKSIKLKWNLEKLEARFRGKILWYGDSRAPYWNPYPYARSVVEYLQNEGLLDASLTIDKSEIEVIDVGPKFDFSLNQIDDELKPGEMY